MRCAFDSRKIIGELPRHTRASTRRRFPRSLGYATGVVSLACHRSNARSPVFDPIGLTESVRASANPRLMDALPLRRHSALDALPSLPAPHCQAVQGHGRLFLPCLPWSSHLRKPKKKPQSPCLFASLQAAADAWRFAAGGRPHTTPTIPDEKTTIPKAGGQN
jgi:hypothetical protein